MLDLVCSVVNISDRPPAYTNLMFTTQTDIIAQKSSSGQSVFYVWDSIQNLV